MGQMTKERRREILKGTQWEEPDKPTDLIFGEIGYPNTARETLVMCSKHQQPVIDGTVISDLSDESVRRMLEEEKARYRWV
jgi:hypothetical protein